MPVRPAVPGFCAELASAVHPSTDLIDEHLNNMEQTTEPILSRLDELVSMLEVLKAQSSQQRSDLAPALTRMCDALDRDFAYINRTATALQVMKAAVENMEYELEAAEARHLVKKESELEKAKRMAKQMFSWGGRGKDATAEPSASPPEPLPVPPEDRGGVGDRKGSMESVQPSPSIKGAEKKEEIKEAKEGEWYDDEVKKEEDVDKKVEEIVGKKAEGMFGSLWSSVMG